MSSKLAGKSLNYVEDLPLPCLITSTRGYILSISTGGHESSASIIAGTVVCNINVYVYIYMYIYQATNQLKLYIYMCVISLSHSVSHHFSIHKSKENVNPLSPPSKISRLIMLQNIPLGYYQVTYDFFFKHGSQVCSSYIPKFHYPSQKRH